MSNEGDSREDDAARGAQDQHDASPAAGEDSAVPDSDAADLNYVEREREGIKSFVASLSGDDINSGGWFTRLVSHALRTYTEKVDWQYFQERYKGVPADAIVDQRIKMAARYAALEGGLSAGAYTAVIVATLGSLGGASPATVPTAVATMMVDLVFVTQLQLRLAYDVSVLYRVPLNLDDPADLWKLIRVAFVIRGGELVREGAVKAIPAIIRPLIKRYYSGAVLAAAKGIPYVGKFLLQRNIIKIGIPLVGVPLAIVVNRYSTTIAGRHARAVFRNGARVIEVAHELSSSTSHPQMLLWVAWLVVTADNRISDDDALLMRYLVKRVEDEHGVIDDSLAEVIEIDPTDVWRRIDDEAGDMNDVLEAAQRVATIDGPINSSERQIISTLQVHCASREV